MLDKAVKNLSGSVVVIGLGRFGTGVAKSLVELGHDVLAIESDAETVQSLASRMAYSNAQVERFRVLHGLAANAQVVPGQRYKIVLRGG